MVGFAKNRFTRIKNPHRKERRGDFEFSVFSFLFMLLLSGLFSGLSFVIAAPGFDVILIGRGFAAVAVAALVYLVFPRWSALIPALLVAQTIMFIPLPMLADQLGHGDFSLSLADMIAAAGFALAIVFGPSLQVVLQWDKVVVLRLGRFHKVHDPGPFFMLPLFDHCAAFVDTRIRVTDFSAEKILTRDTVPVHVDALAFWMIWDARKAILEVENFLEAVTLSAQTALRDSIGKYSLTTLLSERETLYQEIQSILDAKTNPWGITILSVEFTDILLPTELEDVMSRQAQAEREKEARLYLARAEKEVAGEFAAAAEVYRDKPEALNLRAMNMVYDGIKNNGSLVLLPSGALENMNLGATMGVSSLAKSRLGESSPGTEQIEDTGGQNGDQIQASATDAAQKSKKKDET